MRSARRRHAGDFIIHGGPIYTGLADTAACRSRAQRDGRIVVAGALADAQAERGARLIDLGGAAAFPALSIAMCISLGVGLRQCSSIWSGLNRSRRRRRGCATMRRRIPEGPITGRGWIETHWPERRFPNRADLDAIVADRPVILGRGDGHVVNSAALAHLAASAPTPQIPRHRLSAMQAANQPAC
ncbi:MAG: amidohydrolase family protein [Hyphomonadaceae bacterium]